jgi:hypothetical protein
MAKIKQPIPMHDSDMCEGTFCPFHNPSDHHMKNWKMVIRYDRGGLVERICKHGVGHPDPDSLAWLKSVGSKDDGVHGCCGYGCCSDVRGVTKKVSKNGIIAIIRQHEDRYPMDGKLDKEAAYKNGWYDCAYSIREKIELVYKKGA